MTNNGRRRVALITGCGHALGIGDAVARTLSAAGVTVAVNDIVPGGLDNHAQSPSDLYAVMGVDPEWRGLDSLVSAITDAGGTASAIIGDVSSEADAKRMVAEVVDRHGSLDILVNNAAAPQGPDRVDIAELSLQDWQRVLTVNATGSFLMSREAIKQMRKQSYGRIVNVASFVTYYGYRYLVAYTASKSAILGLTRAAAQDVRGSGITINAVCPGAVGSTRSLSGAWATGGAEAVRAAAERMSVTAQEHANVIAFLASEAASYVNGQWFNIDGGGPALAVHRHDAAVETAQAR